MLLEDMYDDIKTELQKLNIPYEEVAHDDTYFWIPYLCSHAKEDDDPLIYVSINEHYFRIDVGKTEQGFHIESDKYKFNINELNKHNIMSKILNYYYTEIDKE